MKIIIEDKAYLKLNKFVNLVDTEISGMAKSIIDKDKNIIIKDFIIFEQEVSGASTVISDKSQAQFLNQLMKKNEDPRLWNIWWHSHANMDVFWSTIDNKTIEDHTNQSYLISLVVNKKMEMKARLDIYPTDNSPFKQATYCQFDITDIEILSSKEELTLKEKLEKLTEEYIRKSANIEKKFKNKNDKKIEALCQKEIDEKVKTNMITYDEEYNKNLYNFSKQNYFKRYKPKKRWNWFDGIIDNTPEEDDTDWFNKQQKLIGFNY